LPEEDFLDFLVSLPKSQGIIIVWLSCNALQTQGAVLDQLERLFMHGETKNQMGYKYGKGLNYDHTCTDALVNDVDGGHHTDTVIYFKQVWRVTFYCI
jgi:hypothetical protein